MNLTSKSRYALKIMMDLTVTKGEDIIKRGDIADRQGIPSDYMDQIMVRLRAAGLIESVRGRSGGYRLMRDPALISLWDIFSAVEDAIHPVDCVSTEASCDFAADCAATTVWGQIFSAMQRPLLAMNLASLVSQWGVDGQVKKPASAHICKSGPQNPIVGATRRAPLSPVSGV